MFEQGGLQGRRGCCALLGGPQALTAASWQGFVIHPQCGQLASMGSAAMRRVSSRALGGRATSLGATGAGRDGAFRGFGPGAMAL